MSDYNTNDGKSIVIALAAIVFVVLLCTGGGFALALNAAGMLGNSWLDREIVESSRQYSESNTAAFYSRLESVNKISVQLASTTLTPEMRAALTSQRDLLESEMRREVDKIPVGSRTSAMYPYSNN